MKKILAIALLTIVSVVSAFAQNGMDEQELIRLQKEWRAAIERGDRDALNRFIADDFSNSNKWNKAQQIEQSLKTKERQSNTEIRLSLQVVCIGSAKTKQAVLTGNLFSPIHSSGEMVAGR